MMVWCMKDEVGISMVLLQVVSIFFRSFSLSSSKATNTSLNFHFKAFTGDGCLSICFLGNYHYIKPSAKQMMILADLIKIGIVLGYISENYKIFCQCQAVETKSPEKKIYEIIQIWKHWSNYSVHRQLHECEVAKYNFTIDFSNTSIDWDCRRCRRIKRKPNMINLPPLPLFLSLLYGSRVSFSLQGSFKLINRVLGTSTQDKSLSTDR